METLVGKKAPAISAQAVVNGQIVNNFNLEAFKGKTVVLFFYPLDFTFVCPTELHAFEEAAADFAERNAVVVGCSVDSAHSHLAWLRQSREQGGIRGVNYPLIADLTKSIATQYGVLMQEAGIAYRGLFIIDGNGTVRHQLVNDLPIGRSVDEVLRTIDAIAFFDQNGEVCPANWKSGEKAMKASHEGVVTYFASV